MTANFRIDEETLDQRQHNTFSFAALTAPLFGDLGNFVTGAKYGGVFLGGFGVLAEVIVRADDPQGLTKKDAVTIVASVAYGYMAAEAITAAAGTAAAGTAAVAIPAIGLAWVTGIAVSYLFDNGYIGAGSTGGPGFLPAGVTPDNTSAGDLVRMMRNVGAPNGLDRDYPIDMINGGYRPDGYSYHGGEGYLPNSPYRPDSRDEGNRPRPGQTLRPGGPHTIADARAQERDYANSQGSRPSVNPRDIHRDEGSRPGPGQTLNGRSGGSGGGGGGHPYTGGGSGGSGSSVTGGRGTPSPTTGGSTPSRPSTPSTPSTRNDPGDPGRVGPQPVVLDLDGNGFDISTLDTSNTFVAMDESGLLTRTAWARGNDGVLVIDANNDGKISSSKEFVFTEWANGARTDFEALKQVFDTNHNGKLDAGDARFGEFRVSVGGQLVSLASLGITSIDLTATGSGQVFADGSAITGTSTFVRNGVTYQAGDANSKTGITRIVAEANFAPALLH